MADLRSSTERYPLLGMKFPDELGTCFKPEFDSVSKPYSAIKGSSANVAGKMCEANYNFCSGSWLSDVMNKLDKLSGDGDFLGKKLNGSISPGLEELLTKPIPSMLRLLS
ncbi:hypothetical protein ACS0TY_033597 [Phlomoides rotata]